MNKVCQKAGVSITATANRHRMSTLYASMHMTDENKQMFFDHTGHSEAMSKDNYQCPSGVKEINIMGKMLGHMDTCKYHCLFVKKY